MIHEIILLYHLINLMPTGYQAETTYDRNVAQTVYIKSLQVLTPTPTLCPPDTTLKTIKNSTDIL